MNQLFLAYMAGVCSVFGFYYLTARDANPLLALPHLLMAMFLVLSIS